MVRKVLNIRDVEKLRRNKLQCSEIMCNFGKNLESVSIIP